ncbi:heavy metal translocating P-type ATPase [Alkalihalobacterium chitinilyticum]|uniref:Heavy metal translocating P-type ATPase n=1 Tax=Alkalihalobacterium chitinilyticum TaxID=2980103 RepID=A0ABT5VK71_9BACI|nr:heavy metal translocating P-type ATPase [Alkalihalobacterium chitinilyticum]MDE5414659.1 heavy metal translocating P-type ATPase [Alkalihalobacterium chitinilyticum]
MILLRKWIEHRQLLLALASGILIVIAWALELSASPAFLTVSIFIIAYLIGGFYKAKEGIEEFINERKFSVEILMILAAIGAATIGYWMEGAILIFIFALSGALETYTMNKSHQEISALMNLQPEEATLLKDGMEKTVAVSELRIGDLVRVKPGERISTDGVIFTGRTTIDESALTGESLPISKQVDEEVFTGTVNLSGMIDVSVTKPAEETLFQKIITLVQSAKDEKSPSQLTIEKFEGPYVKVVLIFVTLMMLLPYFFLGWSWHESFYRAMVLLVVASPCALVASVMPATLSAISNGARQGILFKGGVHLEQLAHIKAIALDKTGTITNGTPVVTNVYFHPVFNENDLLYAICAIENQSSHPLAKAIVTYCKQQGIEPVKPDFIENKSGWGIIGTVDGEGWKIGKPDFFSFEKEEAFQEIAAGMSDAGQTLVFAGKENQDEVIAVFAIEDTIRDVAIEAIKSMKNEGITAYMITGDHEKTAKKIASEVELDGYSANCLPEEKVIEIEKLKKQFQKVAMVGDGINDAPALARANIGIAMGAGSDAAIETADIVLVKNDLAKITKAIQLSKRLNRIVMQNIIFSIAVILLLIVGNFMQHVSLPLGVIGHEGSTILVILNGLRLLKN